MYEIETRIRIEAPIEVVFDVIADHERFFDGPDQEYCRLTTDGREERNGLGAVREICAQGMIFSEEITSFERPTRLEYVVRSLTTRSGRNLPLRHEIGWMQFATADEATEVEWRSRFEIPIPMVGKVMEIAAGRWSKAGFLKLLARARKEIEREVHVAPPA